MCVCFFFLRQECLGMPELQRAAEFFFSAGSILKWKKKKVNMLICWSPVHMRPCWSSTAAAVLNFEKGRFTVLQLLYYN